jgi:hypothetical protein
MQKVMYLLLVVLVQMVLLVQTAELQLERSREVLVLVEVSELLVVLLQPEDLLDLMLEP